MTGAKLGQHFLTRPEIARWVPDSIPLTNADTVLEIGPGHGILTRELLHTAKKVIALEKDSVLFQELELTFSKEIKEGKLILLEKDVRDFDPSTCEELADGYIVAANIPYYITGYIIRLFLTTAHQPKAISVLIQKEVAERIVAKNGKHSLLSLSVHTYGTPKLEKVVKSGAFSPPPKVDSAILSIKNISKNAFKDTAQEDLFFALLHAGFKNKRKMLKKQIQDICTTKHFLQCEIKEKARAEDLTLEQWFCLSKK